VAVGHIDVPPSFGSLTGVGGRETRGVDLTHVYSFFFAVNWVRCCYLRVAHISAWLIEGAWHSAWHFSVADFELRTAQGALSVAEIKGRGLCVAHRRGRPWCCKSGAWRRRRGRLDRSWTVQGTPAWLAISLPRRCVAPRPS